MSSAHLEKFDSVKPATIEWRDGLPFSLEYNDVYFSAEGGIAESNHVFIQGTELLEDWLDCSQTSFTIAELGFGTGLNFLNTASHWQRHLSKSDNRQTLHYLSIEKRPLGLKDLKRALASWPQFATIASTLVDNYPSPTFGRFQVRFPELNIYLTLLFMPVDIALADLLAESLSRTPRLRVNHWFLDGFAPAKNESMWVEKLFHQIASLSQNGAKLATFSVAAAVKQPLIKNGFEIEKRKGFAKKREMLTAVYRSEKVPHSIKNNINLKYEKPWFNLASTNNHNHNQARDNQSIAIIGGGIAGCTLAYTLANTLANEHQTVVLYEAQRTIASKASGAAAGIFHPQLTSDLNLSSQFNWQAYLCLINWLSQQPKNIRQQLFISFGLERFLKDQRTAAELMCLARKYHLDQWIVDKIPNGHSTKSIYFPDAGAIDIKALCDIYIEQAITKGLVLKTKCRVDSIDHSNGNWQVSANDQISCYQHVIYCGGADNHLMEGFNAIPTNISRGQTCYLEHPELFKSLNHTLCEKVYLVPSKPQHLHIGSTFDDFIDEQINRSSQIEMLTRTSSFLDKNGLGALSESIIKKAALAGTVGYRLHSMDRLPLVGAAFDTQKLLKDFSQLGQKKIQRANLSSYNQTGAWLNTAYGSHGLIYSLLGSQHLSSLINNYCSPLSNSLSNAVNPARFFIKSLK